VGALATGFLRAMRGPALGPELGPELGPALGAELRVDSGVRFNMVKGGNLRMGWESGAVFGRRGMNEKSGVESDCIIVRPCALVKQSKVGTEGLKYS